MGWPKPIEEGPVKITYSPSKAGRVKMVLEIDYAKTNLDGHHAAIVNKTIVDVLRDKLGVVLSEFR